MYRIDWVEDLKEKLDQIKDSDWFRVFVSPLGVVLVTVTGNTAGIWFGWILIKYVLSGFFENLTWPGLNVLINEGVLLLVSFSFLSTIIYESSRRGRINLFNVLGILILLAVCLTYTRAIGLRQVQQAIEGVDILSPDTLVYIASLVAFFGSICLLYSLFAHEKYVKLGGRRPNHSRAEEEGELKRKFNANRG